MNASLRLLSAVVVRPLRFLAGGSALGALALFTGVQAQPAERIARIESSLAPRAFAEGRPIQWTIQERLAYHKVPGVSIAVINDGRIEWARGYGVLEAGVATPVDADTLFQAASISKPVSAMALLRLVESGNLKLDQDVNEVLKSWKVPANAFTADEKVTLRRLLSHTAGLTVHGFRGYAEDEALPTLPQMLDGTRPANSGAIRVDLKPGTQERYSGGGYVVMHQLARDVTGESFEALLQSSVLQPLGMTRSTFEQPLPAAWTANAARAHRGDGKRLAGRWHVYPELAPDGLWTTPSDLARFAIEIQQSLRGGSNKVLSTEMTKQFLTRQLRSMGLGIVVSGTGDALRFEHGGANEGFRCNLVAYAAGGRGCVIMTNGDRGGELMMEIQRAIAAEYGWPDYRPVARRSVAVEPQALAEYAGSYRVPGGGPPVNVAVQQGELAVDVNGRRANLIAETPRRFRVLEDETTATFFTVSGQKALWAQNRFWLMTAGAASTPSGPSAPVAASKGAPPAPAFLVFRNTASWNRPNDFEHVLRALGHPVDVKASSTMGDVDLSRYAAIIVPGAQPQPYYYPDYIRHAARFDAFVAQGGTLIFELNGAEGTGLVLPLGVKMTPSSGLENTLLATTHPIFAPWAGEHSFRANAASHGYLSGVPKSAIILAVESNGGDARAARPTFVEYAHGKGRVIAACQCFHDQDGSGRGPWMATLVGYASARSWVGN